MGITVLHPGVLQLAADYSLGYTTDQFNSLTENTKKQPKCEDKETDLK